MASSKTTDPFARRVLTNQEFEHEGFLTISEYQKFSGPGQSRLFDLVVENGIGWRMRGKNVTRRIRLTRDQWAMLVGYVGAPWKSLTPRSALGRPGSHEGALFSFKAMRGAVDVSIVRGRGELFRHDGSDSRGNDLFSFNPPAGFRYALVLPYVPDDLPELSVRPQSALYQLTPATGVFLEVTLEKRTERALSIYDASIEVSSPAHSSLRKGVGGKPKILPICRLIADAIPDPELPIPPFAIHRDESLLHGTWPFDLVDEKGDVILLDAPTPAFLCVEAGAKRRVIRLPISIRRQRYASPLRTQVPQR